MSILFQPVFNLNFWISFSLETFSIMTAQAPELLFEALIPALDIHDIIHDRDPVSRQPCDAQRRACPKIRRAHSGPGESLYAFDRSGSCLPP